MPRRVICAPDSLKESLTAAEAAHAMAKGVARAWPDAEVDLCPIADGGEGTVDAMLAATNGEARTTRVTGPLGEPVDARWGLLGRATDSDPLTAVIEMAAASGLALVPEGKRDPTRTTTYGTGALIKAALDAGARRIILGIGGSATNDAGLGCAQALGVRFFTADKQQFTHPMTGSLLADVTRIDATDRDSRLANTQLIVACDVTNPLTGPNGAAHIYGPQKGATPQQVQQLDANLRHIASLMRDQLDQDVETTPGAGAAGGLGAGLVALLGGKLQPGVAMVLDMVHFESRAKGCDLCLTSEGKLDGQSISGKACLGVANAALNVGVKTIALPAVLGPDVERTLQAGLHAYRAFGQDLPKAESMQHAAELLADAAEHVVRHWREDATSHVMATHPRR